LESRGIEFKLVDADVDNKLADRMEALLKINAYPMVIVERLEGNIYLYREDSYEKAVPSPVAFATKVGCVTIASMIEQIKKYLK
jgi:hypothetical protein